ncbi:hypothetical protein [Clostridium fungisolvens]|uniref:Uncharacterized protein n=1 Tax=Clostridium fungisolvens TaxID=1604897 RepID=A0A6V8SE89_9CLOT|nr:hypothetical protein [Clostridium fungisolvens]GFP75544.1 hypothetical protein bsdtw1_01628 [Clostridium fungisolvens]
MQNILWFIGLAIIGILSAIYAIYKKKHIYKISTFFVFYLFAASIAWCGEFLVLGLFNSYAYKTGVLQDVWAQNLLGHLILNTTLYPSAAVVMVAFSFKFGWISFVAALFTAIEYVFVNLRLYEQHWWRYYMTAIAVVGILLFDNMWFPKINKKCYGLNRAFVFYFVAMIIVHIPAPILLLMSKQYYKLGFVNKFFGDIYLSSIIIIFFYHMIEAFLLVLFTCILKKWYWSVLPFIISIVAQSIFVKMGILIIESGWNLVYTLILYEIFIAIFILIEKYTVRPQKY